MGNNLNPDGAKIKAMRIQRGWTQEQLAEIAGISARTIQRAEKANTAAFDTLRAIAGAFETDFDQLLKPEGRNASEPEPNIGGSEPLHNFEQEPAVPAMAVQPFLPIQRLWPLYVLTAAALAAGLFAGTTLTLHLHKTAEWNSALASSGKTALPQAAISPSTDMAAAMLQPTTLAEKPASEARMVPVAARAETRRAKNDTPRLPEPAAAPAATPALHASLHSTPQAVFSELSPESRDFLSTYSIPEMLPANVKAPAPPGDSAMREDETGAVRQALGQAAKKTGSFMSRVGTSLKRAF